MNGMQNQWWQGELIHHLGFIIAVTKVRNVVFMRDIGLSDDHRTRCHSVSNGAEELNQTVRLFKMDAACSGDLPHKADRIKADIARPSIR